MFPIANKTWFANKSTTQHSNSKKFRKNYSKQKVYIVINPKNFISFHAANYSEQFNYPDNTQNKIEFYRTNYKTYEAQNFSEHASYVYEHPINFLEFI